MEPKRPGKENQGIPTGSQTSPPIPSLHFLKLLTVKSPNTITLWWNKFLTFYTT